ncbi:energy-coupling factor transporter transmembrane protein EcfT [Haladaptatus sp. W1]|uniref:energy-coupling factor transporter transmembrane component T family protein n=1 Tax=Haladaptatus sp. W1 TaxID=1897478 RepID=UPI0015862523|nr:energy-coupling factor transporter transmembrane component T [Haladaptatus sp. W1]
MATHEATQDNANLPVTEQKGVEAKDAPTQRRKKTLFGYVPAESWVYSFHPLTRLSIMVIFAFLPLAVLTTELNIMLVGIWIMLLLTANVTVERLKFFFPLIVTMFIFMVGTYLFFPGNTTGMVAFKTGFVTGYFEPLMFAFANYWRIIALVFAAIFYATTNRERDIIVALRQLNISFGVVYVLSLAFRSAGLFLDDLSTIREAEHAKGLDTGGMSVTNKVKHYVMYIVPLFTLAIRRITHIEDALFARGYHDFEFSLFEKSRPNYLQTQYQMHLRDYVVIIGAIGIALVVFYLALFQGWFQYDQGIVYDYLRNAVQS